MLKLVLLLSVRGLLRLREASQVRDLLRDQIAEEIAPPNQAVVILAEREKEEGVPKPVAKGEFKTVGLFIYFLGLRGQHYLKELHIK